MKIIFFDGYCTLCNGFVDWGMRRDKKKLVFFSSLQSESAPKYVDSQKYLNEIDTVVYYRDGQVYDRSDAILLFLQDIGGVWKLVSLFRVIPKSIRDFFYKIVAKNRHVIFKKRDTCRLPTEEEKARFLL